MSIRITERAVARLLQTAAKENVDLATTKLRVAVVPGGCSGLSYDLGWDTAVGDSDSVATVNGLEVVLDKKSLPYIEGSELDFSEGLEGKGFHFVNPQAARTCACGESFGL